MRNKLTSLKDYFYFYYFLKLNISKTDERWTTTICLLVLKFIKRNKNVNFLVCVHTLGHCSSF